MLSPQQRLESQVRSAPPELAAGAGIHPRELPPADRQLLSGGRVRAGA